MVSPTQAISEVFGRDARKVDREIAADKARPAALQPGQAAGDIIVAEGGRRRARGRQRLRAAR